MGVVVVALALAGGALALVRILDDHMTEAVETTARAQLSDVAALLKLGELPSQLPSGQGDTFTQVVSQRGQVLASTATLLATAPISRIQPGEEGKVIRTIPVLTSDFDLDGPFLLVSESVPPPPRSGVYGDVTVYVAATLSPVSSATGTLVVALAAGLPVLLAIVGLLLWILTGRALSPVEAIRTEVADITARDIHRRVPEPATRDEVALLASTMNEMLDRLEASAAAQRRFVADASHELRSPLAVLQATLEVAIAHPDDTAWPGVALDALDETRRLHRLVENLLALANLEGNQRQRREEVDLDEIVLRDAQRRRPGSRVTIDLHGVSGGRVIGDPDQLARVVVNLVDNAQRHASSLVVIRLREQSGTVRLDVEDDGPGVPTDQRERIFERFARLDESRTQDSGGTGLGLALVREIVEAHGGSVRVVDGAIGARFVAAFQAAEPPDDEADDPIADDQVVGDPIADDRRSTDADHLPTDDRGSGEPDIVPRPVETTSRRHGIGGRPS